VGMAGLRTTKEGRPHLEDEPSWQVDQVDHL
jgi:hypothetical protein